MSLLFASGGQSIGAMAGRPGQDSSSAANFLLRLQKKKVFKFYIKFVDEVWKPLSSREQTAATMGLTNLIP